MTRQTLPESAVHPAIRTTIATHHNNIIDEVKAAIASNPVVVVGMGQNPFAKKARKALNTIDQAYKYLEYGNYLSKWRERNALKMWCGWPTIPMVFVKGTLIGGANDLEKLISSGELKKLLSAKG
jgi:monothiol glutaredoxin